MRFRSILCILAFLGLPGTSFAQTPVFVLKWGTRGSGVGQLNSPFGLGLDGIGNVYVADTFNNRVQLFSPSGAVLRVLGSAGAGPGQLSSPTDVAVSPTGDAYVADYGNLRISVWDAGGAFIRSFPTRWHPGSIAIDNQGQFIYVLFTDGYMQKLTVSGDTLATWLATGSSGMQGFGVSTSGNVYLSTGTRCSVRGFSPDGHLLSEWFAASGGGPGQCSSFDALALDSDMHIILTGNDGRCQEFTAGGQFIGQWGSAGSGDGQFFSTVPDIVVDSEHDIYVLDTENNRVEKFSDIPTAVLPTSWGRLKMLYR